MLVLVKETLETGQDTTHMNHQLSNGHEMSTFIFRLREIILMMNHYRNGVVLTLRDRLKKPEATRSGTAGRMT